jgi:YidC/Oxa1 family membrane protein insertase
LSKVIVVLARVLSPLIAAEEWLLEGVHALGAGWGIAIVALTLLVRVLTVPLTASQVRSQRELREHLPELKRLQQRYKHDHARLQRATADYYRRHGINPLKAFAPLLVQIPIFISLYYVLRSDVSSGLFGDAGFLFIPNLGDKPHPNRRKRKKRKR